MKLQQLRYIVAMVRHNLNVSQTADALYTSQPGVSKQIRALEDELGVELFERRGKQVVSLTEAGERVVALANEALSAVDAIRTAGREFANPHVGELAIATTHTQARYVLPPVIEGFRDAYPHVALRLHQGTPAQIAEMVLGGEADLAISTEGGALFDDLIQLPCYRWNRSLLVPAGHPLQRLHALGELTLEALSQYPIVTYTFGFTARSRLDTAFVERGLSPNVVLSASDVEVIRTYVALGLGVGIVATLAVPPDTPAGDTLVALDASGLFQPSTTNVALARGSRLRGYTYDLIERFAPHLVRETVDAALSGEPVSIDPSRLPLR
ncbi:MAG: HTH-type transcriptional regulator CysB [Pseudomonadota bacterium]